MQEQGKIRHIGLSEVTPAEIEEAEKIVPIVTVQNRYSLADRGMRKRLTVLPGGAASASCPGIPTQAENC
jgi:aryl-alcohol dehydrogenase-like predicted oxidoreductase